jgi:tetratricopeptide (TPR) repeat protein
MSISKQSNSVLVCLGLMAASVPDATAQAPTQQMIDEVGAQLQEAERYARNSDAQKLLELSERLIKKYPDLSEGYRNRANARRMLKDINAAGQDYNKAIEVDPDNMRAWNGRAQFKHQIKDFPGALADINHALSMDPDYANALDARAMIFHDLKDYRKSIADSSHAIRLAPQNPLFLVRRALALEASGDTQAAVKDYESALAKSPQDAFALAGRARALSRSGQSGAALPGAANSGAGDPRSQPPAPTFEMNGALQEAERLALKGEDQKLLELAGSITRQYPELSGGYRYRAIARRNLKDFKGAVADFNKALELDPQDSRAWNGRAVAKRLQNDLQGALTDFTHALEVKPDSINALDGRAQIYHELKEYGKSIADSSLGLRLSPDNQLLLARRAIAREATSDLQGALRDYEAALAKSPTYAYAQAGRARMLARLGSSGAGETASVRTTTPSDLSKPQIGGVSPPSVTVSRSTGKLNLQIPVLPVPSGELWSVATTNEVPLVGNATALRVSVTDPAQGSGAFPLSELSNAMEGLRSLAGPLTAQQQTAWNKKWQPYFDFPDPESVKYFKELNPLLVELQTIRGVVNQAAQDFDVAWAEAVISHSTGDADGTREALNIADQHAQMLKSANTRMAAIQKKVQALGNPPNPIEAKAKARAWSKKWGSGLARIAYLWRLQQLALNSFNDSVNVGIQQALIESGLSSPGSAVAKPVSNIYLADLETWSSWFNGGEKGPEPKGSTPPAPALLKEAQMMREKWYQPDVIRWVGAGYLLRSNPRQPAEAILAGKMVVPKGPLAEELLKTAPVIKPGFAAPWMGAEMELQPYLKTNQGDTAKPPKPPVPATATNASKEQPVDEEKKTRLEAIAEKENLIEIIQKNLAKDEAQWARESDPTRKEDLYRRVLNNRSAILQERDLMQTLKTGEVVHTRTPSDDYCHDLMVVRSMEEFAKFEESRRMATAAERMLTKLELMAFEGDSKLNEFVARQITSKDLAEGNLDKIRQATKAVYDTLQGRREQESASSLEDAIKYEDYEHRAGWVKSIAGATLMLTGIAAPAYAAGAGTVMSVGGTSTEAITAVNMVYGATTGTIEGGPVEGVKQAVAMTGMAGMVASEMMTGYQRGGLASSGGIVGAVERGAEAFIVGKLVESFAAKAGEWWSKNATNAATAPLPVINPGLTVAEMAESQAFRAAKQQAQKKIQEYEAIVKKIKSTAPNSAEQAELAVKKLQKATEINGDLMAKRILKADGKALRKSVQSGKVPAPREKTLEEDFASAIETINRTQVDPAFRKAVKDAGYSWRRKTPGGQWQEASDLNFRDFRQGAAGRTVNTDRDLGLVELKNQPGEIVQLFKGNQPIKLGTAEEEFQQLYNKTYGGVTGGNAKSAMQNVTTTGNREAYRDLTYTQLNDPANLSRVNKGWAAQSAEVLAQKVAHAGPGTGEFASLFKKIDGANQAAKDIEQRLLPFLKGNQAKATGNKVAELGQDMVKWKEISKALQNVEKDPVAASRQLRVLTGLDSVGEVADLVSKRFMGSVMQH